VDLNFIEYKDVHIHSISVFNNGEHLNGFEIYYLVDGDVTMQVLHHRLERHVLKSKAQGLLYSWEKRLKSKSFQVTKN
jgi:hypothetical protein